MKLNRFQLLGDAVVAGFQDPVSLTPFDRFDGIPLGGVWVHEIAIGAAGIELRFVEIRAGGDFAMNRAQASPSVILCVVLDPPFVPGGRGIACRGPRPKCLSKIPNTLGGKSRTPPLSRWRSSPWKDCDELDADPLN